MINIKELWFYKKPTTMTIETTNMAEDAFLWGEVIPGIRGLVNFSASKKSAGNTIVTSPDAKTNDMFEKALKNEKFTLDA